MKKILFLFLFLFLFLAFQCTKKEEKEQLKEQLSSLKVQKQELESKIKELEKKVGSTSENTEKTKNVRVEILSPQTFKHYIETQGIVEPTQLVNVGSSVGGRIVSVLVKEGDAVKKGQLIATTDNSILNQTLQELEYQLSVATTLYEKQKGLWEQKVGTEIQFIQAKSTKESLEKRIETLKSQGSMSNIYSPISGFVEAVRQKAGEVSAPGMGFIQIVNPSSLKLMANLADIYIGTVKNGAGVLISFPDINLELTSSIRTISTIVNPIKRTFSVEVGIPAQAQLRPNQLALVKINDKSKSNVLVVDQNLVQLTEKGNIVYIAVEKQGKKLVESRIVKTGLSYNGKVEITSGLHTGEKIIIEGYQEVVDGQELKY